MARLEFAADWQSTGSGPVEQRETSAFLTVRVGDTVVTRNEDVWSKTVRDSVLVSTYPLAMWLASSWWRLNWEPLPKQGMRPDAYWRMAHEMGAANEGYVWPHVVFASDNEMMQIWSTVQEPTHEQSVRYMAAAQASMPLVDFRSGVDGFIEAVLRRLSAVGQPESALAQLWQLVQEDRADKQAASYRRIEAALGYDPDEAPEALMRQAQALDEEMGGGSLAELAPIYGRFGEDASLELLFELREHPGLLGTPALPRIDVALQGFANEPPWVRAVAAARRLREEVGVDDGRIDNELLLDLLGLPEFDLAGTEIPGRAGIGIPQQAGQVKFIPRKRHPLGKRFEYSRFIADLILVQDAPQWLTSTDLSTSRQKFQRAFAAEFLCPFDQLANFLEGDYSESGIEDAAAHFGVSERTVESMLANNGVIPSPWLSDYIQVRAPYLMGV
ncbi:hypothetical protein Xclt_09250 [Xanthomonas axonopodis pv. clitoriae]|uniref:Uncharacterized protein n=1 Tax=Xanthomonas axonopodis pv. clitoriae TaxID=487828 RepID=A0AB73MR44_9XANT|nr:hypothetical protein [Xanthomonas axonopodis]OOW84281.1 hypothetical protein Xclt_09250 [Xanthomonas axonopodis pv. clitoriae]